MVGVWLAVAAALVGCGDDDGAMIDPDDPDAGVEGTVDAGGPVFQPGDAFLLSTDSPMEDEDPFVLRAIDGRLVVAYFSHRDGNGDLYLTSTVDGTNWTDAQRITTHVDADFYPSLFQDPDGTFHLTWFRRQAELPYYAHVRYMRSADGVVWNGERAVTTTESDVEDWTPVIARAADEDLVVYFASHIREPPRYHIFASRSTDDGDTWEDPVLLEDLVDPVEQDHVPFVARVGDDLAMVWTRYDDSTSVPWEPNESADVLLASSSDGIAWSEPVDITDDDGTGAQDLFPSIYLDHDGASQLVWVSTAVPPGAVAGLALADVAAYPSARVELPLAGYSPRVAATVTPGIYLGVWVAGAIGEQELYGRFFAVPE